MAPARCGSGAERRNIRCPWFPGESYDWSYGFSTELRQPVMQYLRSAITSDDGGGNITLSGNSREVHNTWDFANRVQTDPAAWAITDGGTASDTWQYTS